MSFAKQLLDEDEEHGTQQEPEVVEPSRSQDELIADFVRLDAVVKAAAIERKQVSMQLAGIAWENRGEQNTVHLTSTDGQKVSVQFGMDTEYDNEQMFTAANLLGKELFDSLFRTNVEFVAQKRNLKLFMNTVAPDEKIKTAKQIIKDATVTKPKTPYVSVERH